MPKPVWLFAVLLPLTSLSAQTKVSLSSLGAKVEGVRFFPGDGDVMPYGERFYMTEFDSATTRFITMEVELSYPKQTSAVSFTLQCEYVGPKDVASPVLNGTIQPGWKASYHAAGWGAKTRGSWAVGSYHVYCKEGNQVVASGDFKVTRGVYEFPAFNGVVTGLRFFEGGSPTPALADRKYSVDFSASSARRIYTELGVDYPAAGALHSLSVDCRYDFPDDRSFPVTLKLTVQQGWTGSYHVEGLGWSDAGHWPKGDYEVSCRYEGRLVAKGSFSIE